MYKQILYSTTLLCISSVIYTSENITDLINNISSMTDLHIVDLSNNPLGSVSGNYFQNNTILTDIYVGNTNLLLWPTHLLDNATGLQYLDASDNSLLTFLPAGIADGSTVVLTGNLIPTLTQALIAATYPNVNFIF